MGEKMKRIIFLIIVIATFLVSLKGCLVVPYPDEDHERGERHERGEHEEHEHERHGD